MGTQNVVIIGANGQLGRALSKHYPNATALDRDQLDVTDASALDAYPWPHNGVIINAAAYTNVDGAETDEGRIAAWQINAQAVGALASIAASHSATLVHISSEYVFDGSRSLHPEDEPLSPLGVYGQSKAAGDIAAATALKHYILRTSWVVGDGGNFVRTMMMLAAKGVTPKVVSDQVGRLTFTQTIVAAIEHLLQTNASYGTYNVSNDGEPASWAAVASEVYEQCGQRSDMVTAITTAEYFSDKAQSAPRPLQSELDLRKIKTVGFTPTDWRTELARYVSHHQGDPA